jgi:hypothetical protein
MLARFPGVRIAAMAVFQGLHSGAGLLWFSFREASWRWFWTRGGLLVNQEPAGIKPEKPG